MNIVWMLEEGASSCDDGGNTEIFIWFWQISIPMLMTNYFQDYFGMEMEKQISIGLNFDASYSTICYRLLDESFNLGWSFNEQRELYKNNVGGPDPIFLNVISSKFKFKELKEIHESRLEI